MLDSRDNDRGERRHQPLRRVLVLGLLSLMLAAVVLYLVLIIAGKIPKEQRLGSVELSLLVLGCLFVLIVGYPEALSRVSLLKLPGGIELTLSQIQQTQQQQQHQLDVFFRILANDLRMPEKYHLRALARGGEPYVGAQSLREELFRLMRYGLIEEVSPQKIGDIFDGRQVDIAKWVRLTPTGSDFLRRLGDIEAH